MMARAGQHWRHHARALRLMVGFHSHGSVLPVFAQSLAELTAHLMSWGVAHTVLAVEDCLVERGRDRIAATFLASECSHLLMLDGDLEFAAADVELLLATGKPLVAGPYRMKDSSGRYAVSLPEGAQTANWDPATRSLDVAGAGTGFMLIAREVFARMAAALPEIAYVTEAADGSPVAMHAFFETRVIDGRRVSEDINFCWRWRALGGQVWVCPDVRLNHWGRQVWTGSMADDMAIGRAVADAVAAAG